MLLLLEYSRHRLALRHLSWLFYLFNSLYHLLTSTNLQGQIFHFIHVFFNCHLTYQPVLFTCTLHCQSPLYLLFLIFFTVIFTSCHLDTFIVYQLLSILYHQYVISMTESVLFYSLIHYWYLAYCLAYNSYLSNICYTNERMKSIETSVLSRVKQITTQVGCMRWVFRAGALGRPRGMG